MINYDCTPPQVYKLIFLKKHKIKEAWYYNHRWCMGKACAFLSHSLVCTNTQFLRSMHFVGLPLLPTIMMTKLYHLCQVDGIQRVNFGPFATQSLPARREGARLGPLSSNPQVIRTRSLLNLGDGGSKLQFARIAGWVNSFQVDLTYLTELL